MSNETNGDDSLWGRVVSGEDPPEDGVHPLLRVVVAAEAAQRVLEQVRHGQRAELLLHCSQQKLLEASNQQRNKANYMAELRSGMGATIY